jgi:prepilin-type processing-associated H-X9-DG protein
VFFRNGAIRMADITDGSSSTLLVGERSSNLSNATWVSGTAGQNCTRPGWALKQCVPNTFSLILSHTGPSPADPGRGLPADTRVQPPSAPDAGPDGYWARHPGGCNFLLCDGSVRFVKSTISPAVFSGLATRAGAEPVGDGGW